MKVVILAGGAGNRLGGDTVEGPKPMLEIGSRPILWHIMSHYSSYGFDEFIVAVGHRGEMIKSYFAEFGLSERDVRIDLASGEMQISESQTPAPAWLIDIVDTGRWTESGGRVLRLKPLVGDQTFMLTFGDAVSDVDLEALLTFHRASGKLATITVVHPPPRFGELRLEGNTVTEFSEKPMESGWINGGFMVLEPEALDYIDSDDTPLTPGPMVRLAEDAQLAAYRHEGFWQAVDSMRDKVLLDQLWREAKLPWAVSA